MRWWWCEARAGGALASERVGSVLTAPLSLEARSRLRGRPYGIIQAWRARLSPSQPPRRAPPHRAPPGAARASTPARRPALLLSKVTGQLLLDLKWTVAADGLGSLPVRRAIGRAPGEQLPPLVLSSRCFSYARSCTTSGSRLLVQSGRLAFERRRARNSARNASLRECTGVPARCALSLARALDLGRNASSRNVDHRHEAWYT